MSIRTKLVLALVGCTTLAAMAVGLLSYRLTAVRLRDEVDDSLTRAVELLLDDRRAPSARALLERSERISSGVELQLLGADGRTLNGPAGVELPVDDADLELAGAEAPGAQRWSDVELDGESARMLTTSIGGGTAAVQAARSLEEVQRVLSALRLRILSATAAVTALAAMAGWLIARQLTGRLTSLTAAAEQVAATGDLSVAVPVDGGDESARLGAAFNEMVGALARSREEQQRLVQDAGHELRTPMTSLRANIYALRRIESLDADERVRVLDDLESETEELSQLIDEVVEVATDRRGDEPAAPIDLAVLAEEVAARARARSGRDVVVHTGRPVVVMARAAALRRALANLVENAAKFDRSDQPIEVSVDGGTVQVADRGPGIDAGDLPHVFERFYRSERARSEPGSGLGLSIVAEVVAAHDGEVFAGPRVGGGAVVGFRLPEATAPAP